MRYLTVALYSSTGTQDDRDGMFDTIIRNKSHYQKRAYQCIKCLVTLFTSCPIGLHMLRSNSDFARKWEVSVNWLHEELERRPFTSGNQYNYDWSPPAPSNDSSNSYYLERSPSVRLTLKAAIELLPEEVDKQDPSQQQTLEEHAVSSDTISPQPGVESRGDMISMQIPLSLEAGTSSSALTDKLATLSMVDKTTEQESSELPEPSDLKPSEKTQSVSTKKKRQMHEKLGMRRPALNDDQPPSLDDPNK